MGFHSGNRQLPSPGSSVAASTLRRELEAINAKTGIANQCGRAADERLAYNKYHRSISSDRNQLDNMSRGGNGRGAVRNAMHSSPGSVTSYDHAQTQGPPIMFIFWAGVIWIAIVKMGMQPLAMKILGAIGTLIGTAWPIIVKLIVFCGDTLADLIRLIFHLH